MPSFQDRKLLSIKRIRIIKKDWHRRPLYNNTNELKKKGTDKIPFSYYKIVIWPRCSKVARWTQRTVYEQWNIVFVRVKKWYLHLPEWYRLSLRVRRRLPLLLALVPGLEDPPEGPVDGSPALLRTARTDTQSVLLHHNSTQTDRQSHASHMLGSPHTFSLQRNPTYTIIWQNKQSWKQYTT